MITSCENMFNGLNNIVEIDLSNFDTSEVTIMNAMFKDCTNLEKINFGEIDTKKVTNMQDFCNGCHKLESINLSKFDTSSVTCMSFMFSQCRSLKSINASSFNTQKVEKLDDFLSYCSNLVSVDLSSFDTTNVRNMQGIFFASSNIKYIDLRNFNILSADNLAYTFVCCDSLKFINLKSFQVGTTNVDLVDFFKTFPQDVKFYIENKTILSEIYNGQIPEGLDDSNLCFQENIIFDEEQNICTCNDNYKFEYNGHCFNECPDNLHQILQDKYKCINSVPENYYLDSSDNIYKKCYDSCKTCQQSGDEEFNNCDVCSYNYVFINGPFSRERNCYQKCDNYYYFTGENQYKCTDTLECPTTYSKLIPDKNKCIDECKNDESIYKYEYNNQCFEQCPENTKINNADNKCLDSCFEEQFEYNNTCYNNCPPGTNRLFNNRRICSKNVPENYYLDEDDNIYKECYQSCKKCEKFGYYRYHHCKECKSQYLLKRRYITLNKIYYNCYSLCDYYYYFDEDNKYYCTSSYSCPSQYSKLVETRNECIIDCKKDSFFIYEYKNKCYEKCPNNTKIYEEQKLCLDSCDDKQFEYNNICYNDCPNSTYRIFKDRKICSEIIPINYYYNETENIYMPCYENCLKCITGGNDDHNNCIECKSNYILLNEPHLENNCFPCEFNYYINDINKDYLCTENIDCPNEYKKIIPEKKKCINKCINDNIYQYEYNGICYQKCPNETYSTENQICYSIYESAENVAQKEIENTRDYITSGKMDGNDHTLNFGNLSIVITTSENQRNQTNSNTSTIDLGKCEDTLIEIYDIKPRLPLLIYKIDYFPENSLIPIVGYEVYHPYNYSKLNLSYCSENTVTINLPVANVDEKNLFKYDPNSDYYRNNCYSYTTENGTDITKADKIEEFLTQNLSLCENNCKYMGYDSSNKQSNCSCYVKNEMEEITKTVNDPNRLANEFENKDSSSSSTMVSMECAYVLFTLDGLKKNISSYLLMGTFIYYLISMAAFIKCGYRLLKSQIKNIIRAKEKEANKNINKQVTNGNSNKIFNKNNIINVKKQKNKFYPPKKVDIKFITNENPSKRYHRVIRSSFFINSKNKLDIFNEGNNKKENENKMNIINQNNIAKNKLKLILKEKLIKYNFNDYDLNTMSYTEAIIYDKRSFCQYYICLIKAKHPLTFGFCPFKDYNSIIIKSCIFFLSFAVYYIINFLLFTEDMIHQIYANGGKYDILYFLPKMSIAFGISHLITVVIKFIFLSERNLYEVKIQKTYLAAYNISYKVEKNLKIKYVFFFICGLILLAIFWVLLSSFGAVFQNSQIILIKNTLISFGISFIYPFFINFIPCIFRKCSLNASKSLGCVYSTSKFFQLL